MSEVEKKIAQFTVAFQLEKADHQKEITKSSDNTKEILSFCYAFDRILNRNWILYCKPNRFSFLEVRV